MLTGAGAFGLSQLSTQFSFLDFVPTTSPLRDTAITLDERFDFPETTSVLVKGDVGTAYGRIRVVMEWLNKSESKLENVALVVDIAE